MMLSVKKQIFLVVVWKQIFVVFPILLHGDGPSNMSVADLVEHMTQLENQNVQLQHDVSAMRDQLQLLQGAFTKISSPKPAFMASLTNDVTECSIGDPIIFDNVLVNVGSGYDSRHGVFRAPRNGTYLFEATLSAKPQKHFFAVLVKNSLSNEMAYVYSGPITEDVWQQRSMSAVVQLNVADDVWFKCTVLSGNEVAGGGHYHSHFAGFLISET